MADLSNYKIFKNNKFQILTHTGFEDFDGIIKGYNENKIKLTFNDNTSLICTPKHKLITMDKSIIYAKDLKIDDILYNNISILSIEYITNNDPIYEILNVHNHNKYLINNKILSKNCIIIDEAAYIPPHIMDEFWNSVIPAVSSSSNSKIFLISCVTDNTYVYTDKGIKQIKEFIDYTKDFGYTIPAYNVLGKDILRSGFLFYNSGKASTKKIKTTFSELECSDNHKLWACKNGVFDWYESKDLSNGDYISIQYGMDVWGNNDDISSFNFKKTNNSCQINIPSVMNTDLGYVIGLYISEGYARGGTSGICGQLSITCGDSIIEYLNALGYSVYQTPDGLHYNINSKELVSFLEYIGFDITKKAPDKIIPPRILEMSKPIIRSILQGMFDGDGSSSSSRGTISYTSTSEQLINQLRIILNNFGILSSKYYYKTKQTKLVNVESDRWVLEISGNASKVFYNNIGFRFNRQQINENILKNISNKNTLDIIPMSQADLKNIIKLNNIKLSDLKKIGINITSNLYTKNNPSYISRNKLLILKQSGLIKNPESIKQIEHCVNDNIRWDKIKSIESSEANVYDFSLPDANDEFAHSVIYNGIIGHQTPNGTSNVFYEIYSKAERGESKTWHHERMEWHELPGRGKKWKLDMIESLGSQEAFDQEFGCGGKSSKVCIRKKNENIEQNIEISKLYDIIP